MPATLYRSCAISLIFLLASASARAQAQIPTRTPVRTIPIHPGKPVDRVEMTRVDFAPSQVMPRHKHLVPVLCFVTRGEFLVKIGDEPEVRYAEGAATYEPAGVTVDYFRKASSQNPAQLACASLASASDTVLNQFLP